MQAELEARWEPDFSVAVAIWTADTMSLLSSAPGHVRTSRAQRSLFGKSPAVVMRRAALSLPLAPLPPCGEREREGVRALAALQGMYAASYSVHGIEVLRVKLAGPDQAAPPGCPAAGTRLEALKLTGDPNVPATK